MSRALCVALLLVAGCGARSALTDEEAAGGGGQGGGVSNPEACNGLDDNGNGQVDEGLGTIGCGVGRCEVTVDACQDGVPGACVPGQPAMETCNGEDDDCDGMADEGLGLGRIGGPYTADFSLQFVGYASMVPTRDGFFFAYGTGFDGSNPTTNVFRGALDTEGFPVQTELPLTDRNMPNGLRISPAESGWFAAYCGRFGFDDRGATGLIAEDGTFTELGVRPPSDNFCGAGTPDGIWTGERYLFAWADNSTFDVRLDAGDASGASVTSTLLSQGTDLYSHPRFAMIGERVIVTYTIVREGDFVLRVHRLDRFGEEVSAPIELQPPSGAGTWMDTQLAADPAGNGFFLMARGSGNECFDALFDADGALVDGPSFCGTTFFVHALAPHPGGGYVIAYDIDGDTPEAAVSRVDVQGNFTDTWYGSGDPGWNDALFAWPTIAAGHGRIAVLYSDLATGPPDNPELRAVSFGCAPGN